MPAQESMPSTVRRSPKQAQRTWEAIRANRRETRRELPSSRARSRSG